MVIIVAANKDKICPQFKFLDCLHLIYFSKLPPFLFIFIYSNYILVLFKVTIKSLYGPIHISKHFYMGINGSIITKEIIPQTSFNNLSLSQSNVLIFNQIK